MLLFALLLSVVGALLPHRAPYNTSSRRVRGAINLHLVPHTHDDVGWLKTVDQYYYGSKNSIQRASVQSILNAVIKELAWNPDRRFIVVEQAFFQRWWAEADARYAALTRAAVAAGQLEFINGGWSMHDEACPSFADMIDNTALGHRMLLREFNVTPRTTWQIDPFGHGSFQASVLSTPSAGFDAVFFMRADWQEIALRRNETTFEMVWAPSPTHGMAGATYAGILYGGYCTVPGLSMDFWSNDEPVMDDPRLEGFNVAQVVNATVATVANAMKAIPQGGGTTVDVMLPLGCDFEWENAGTWYTNTDKLIHFLNLDGRVNAFYSTPSAYAAAKLEAGRAYTQKAADFFPYDFFPHGYLTGFFSSRPALKGFIRESSSLFHAARQLQTFKGGMGDVDDPAANPLFTLERAMGVAQHHDGITGSSKQAVAYDYALQLARGRAAAEALVGEALGALATPGGGAPPALEGCELANATICPALEAGRPVALLVYNQGSQARTVNARVPVALPRGVAAWAVLSADGVAHMPAQLTPASAADVALRRGYYGYNATGDVEVAWLAFQVAGVPPAGFTTVFLVPAPNASAAPRTVASAAKAAVAGDAAISNGVVTLTFDGDTGLLRGYASAATGVALPLAQRLAWYNSSTGTLLPPGPPSGAYIFRPNSSTRFDVGEAPPALALVSGGPVVWEAHQVYAEWGSAVTRLWAGEDAVEFEFTIGPIPHADGLGKEVITLVETPLHTNGTWWTDSNGRDSMKRVFNSKQDFNRTVEEPAAGNYYPAPGFIYTSDVGTGVTLSLLPDRAVGGASLADGALEVMLHRRLQKDDALGVGEALNETGLDASGAGLVVRATQRLLVGASPSGAAVARRRALGDTLWRPLLRFAPMASPAAWLAAHAANFSGLSAPLPDNVHLLTAHAWGPSQLLLRLAHSYEAGEGGAASADAAVSLGALFSDASGVMVGTCAERTVAGGQNLASVPATTYTVSGGGPTATLPILPAPPAGAQQTITLSALAIRTFLCDASFRAREGQRR